MTEAIIVHENGGPEVLRLETRDVGDPGRGEIRVRHTAIGLNFIDVYHRTGLYALDLPFVPGLEAAGVVEAVGDGVTDLAEGDRIVYRSSPGAYCGARILPAQSAIPIPDGVTDEEAAAMCLKGMTARFLIKDTWAIKPGDTILWHAAAGGVGQIACAWANKLGATVIGTAGSPEKLDLARQNGCHHGINIRTEDFAARVREITDGRGVDVVYDSIGKDTFESSLDCLRPRGLMVSFGNASGPVSVPNLGVLAAKGSLFLTRPTMAAYYPDQKTERAGAQDMFKAFADGNFEIRIGQRFPLRDAADAHRALEGRETVGATILQP